MVKKLIPGAGSTHPYPSPTPEVRAPQPELTLLPHQRHTPFSPTPSPLTHASQRSTSSSLQLATMTGVPKTVVKRMKGAALEHVKKALRTNGNLLTRSELGFIRTSCHILGINSKATIRVIVKRAKEKEDH